jgi:hypothetical protein
MRTLAALLLLAQAPAPAPIRVPVARDTWVSAVGPEADANLGGAPRLKLKSIQEMTLLDIDPAPLRGRVIERATLHLHHADGPPLKRVTVSTLGAEFVEGTSAGYAPQPGSSSFARARHPDGPWSYPGSDLTSVVFGQGGTTWRMADAFPPDAEGWQRVAVEPSVVAARVAGLSGGFLAFDDTGSEWTRDGDAFSLRLFPNRFVHSRESGPETAPFFTVVLGAEDREPPGAPSDLRTEPGTPDLPAGEALVSWATPADAGPAGTLGFLAEVDGEAVPRYLVPPAAGPGGRVTMHLRDLGLEGAATARLALRAVDAAGNAGPVARADLELSRRVPKPLPGRPAAPFAGAGPPPKLGALDVAILDELDKVQPVTGAMVPPQPAGYLAANHLWDARSRTLRLHAARNEFVAFQVLIGGDARDARPALDLPGVAAEFGRYRAVGTKSGPLPDPIVPLDAPDAPVPGRTRTSLHAELYVPRDAEAGDHRGTLTLTRGRETLEINVLLRVWDFTLPDVLSFLPEMNCYGLPPDDRDYYRLAHRHRTALNRVPYFHNGRVEEGFAPPRSADGAFDWTDWDRRFGPLFDGSAFADLPRAGVPIECFYLPLFENWPTPMEGNYGGDYWADRAFPGSYRDAFVEASRQFAAHMNERGWDETFFQFYMNGKNNFKANGWSRGTSPWLLDEPANWQDYWALRWFGAAFHEGAGGAAGRAKMAFRADISRPEWQRDALDPLLDYNVVGGAFRRYQRMVVDRKHANGEVVLEYGGTNAVEDSNMQPVGWAWSAWSLGADGILPWQTIGEAGSWERGDALSLFYPARGGLPGPTPSVRLKAYRRGQQDAEYLTLLARVESEPRWALGRAVRDALRLSGRRRASDPAAAEDAGLVDFAGLRPQDAWAVRVQIGEALSAAHPEPRRRLVELRTPRRDPAALAPRYVSVGEFPAPPPSSRAASARPGAPTRARAVRGRPAVADALIDPERPDAALGAEPRSNAISKRERSNAFLVRFDLGEPDPGLAARLESAELTVFAWDPSSQGRTRLEARPVLTPWAEPAAAWTRPAPARTWKRGAFDPGADLAPAVARAVVEPDAGADTADPPVPVRLDLTDLARDWLAGRRENLGVALVPVPDRSVDDGNFTRFQVYASESPNAEFTPTLTIRTRD